MTQFYMDDSYAQWRESRRILAKALVMAKEAATPRHRELFEGLAQTEAYLAVVARGQVLREKFLEAHA